MAGELFTETTPSIELESNFSWAQMRNKQPFPAFLPETDRLEAHQILGHIAQQYFPVSLNREETMWLSSCQWNVGGDDTPQIPAHKKLPSWILSLFSFARRQERIPRTYPREVRRCIPSDSEVTLQEGHLAEAMAHAHKQTFIWAFAAALLIRVEDWKQLELHPHGGEINSGTSIL